MSTNSLKVRLASKTLTYYSIESFVCPNLARNNFLFWNYWRQRSNVSAPQIDTDSDALLNKANIITELVAHYEF